MGNIGTSLFGLPASCFYEVEGTFGFVVDTTEGELVFNDYEWVTGEEFTIPNPAFRFIDGATDALDLPDLEGELVKTATSSVSYPTFERSRQAPMPMQMLYGIDPGGAAYQSTAIGKRRNTNHLVALALLSRDATDGLQSVTYTDPEGTDYTFNAVVSMPTFGDVKRGLGSNVGITLTIPGAELGNLPNGVTP